MTDLNSVVQDADRAFLGVLDVINGDLSTIRTGRARSDLVSRLPILVHSYSSTLTLQELASISTPDSQTILISPWDKNVVEDIIRGIAKSDLNLSPTADGDSVRISIPLLSQERRLELVKMVDKKVEAGKVLLREERQRMKKDIDMTKRQPGVSEDDIRRAVEELDKKTREWEEKIDGAGVAKKKELTILV